jgi:ABC-type uncharacterized transport system permease subunit
MNILISISVSIVINKRSNLSVLKDEKCFIWITMYHCAELELKHLLLQNNILTYQLYLPSLSDTVGTMFGTLRFLAMIAV